VNYISHVNGLIKAKVAETSPLVIFGQNIAAGSCLGGLTRGLKSGDGRHVLNTPNCENTLVATGFGLMLSGVPAMFCMKQQDFLLLGIDQLVNTYNLIRRRNLPSSFSIVNVVVDSGYEGPQSSLNNFYDFCSIARVPGYAITNKHDAEVIIGRHLIAPGFRIIGVSQRLARTEVLQNPDEVAYDKDGEIFQYSEGEDVTVVCFNFSFPQGLALCHDLRQRAINPSLFSVSAMLPVDWTRILKSVQRTKRLVVVDDSKSINGSYQHLVIAAQQEVRPQRLLLLTRKKDDSSLSPNADQFVIDHEQVYSGLGIEPRQARPPRGEVPVTATLERARA
jgi:pyruvate/2-oxoglutarate/acetoin dehydrogenase E1 component